MLDNIRLATSNGHAEGVRQIKWDARAKETIPRVPSSLVCLPLKNTQLFVTFWGSHGLKMSVKDENFPRLVGAPVPGKAGAFPSGRACRGPPFAVRRSLPARLEPRGPRGVQAAQVVRPNLRGQVHRRGRGGKAAEGTAGRKGEQTSRFRGGKVVGGGRCSGGGWGGVGGGGGEGCFLVCFVLGGGGWPVWARASKRESREKTNTDGAHMKGRHAKAYANMFLVNLGLLRPKVKGTFKIDPGTLKRRTT